MQVYPVTQGSMLKAARLGRMLFTETLHPANTRLPVHAHANAAITFLLAGAFTESFGGSDSAQGLVRVRKPGRHPVA